MAEKKQTIVIKKIIVQGGGGHGGSWKVALADFMTALMAFFLVMWLLGQSEETKRAVSDYFSTPSVIEYNFQNYGAEITLEKLFLDVLNEPLKAFQSFMEPADKSPNLLDMGSAKVVAAHLADQMNDIAKNVVVTEDGYDFDIPDYMLFEKGSSRPNASFVKVMDKIKGVTAGLKDADIKITSGLFIQSVPNGSEITANKVALERLDIVRNKMLAALDNSTVGLTGGVSVKDKVGDVDPSKLIGFIRVKVTQREFTSDGRRQRKLGTLFGPSSVDMSTYESYVNKISSNKKEKQGSKNQDKSKANPRKILEDTIQQEMNLTDPPSQTE